MSKKKILFLLALIAIVIAVFVQIKKKPQFALSFEGQEPDQSMVSYTFSGGRFGDCLVTYLHAQWLAYKYQLPLAYRPFPHAEKLHLGQQPPCKTASFKAIHIHDSEAPFAKLAQISLEQRKKQKELHAIRFYPEAESERGPNYQGPYLDINWSDQNFKQKICQLIQPLNPIPLILPPKDRFSIAIHWRSGSGADTALTKNSHPCKLPPEEYYLTQLLYVCQRYQQPLFIHLFTDDQQPQLLAQKMRSFLQSAGVQSDLLFSSTAPSSSDVLTDFFSMAQFDCLIRPESNLSLVAQLIGNHQLVIAPTRFCTLIDKKTNAAHIVIDQLSLFENGVERKQAIQMRYPFIPSTSKELAKCLKFHQQTYGITAKEI